jgi:peptidoglycan/LPS O-acetylase OafA/YrhL
MTGTATAAATEAKQAATKASPTDAAAHQAFLARRTFGSLDGLRCLAIVAVVWHHARGVLGSGRLAGRGFLGVDLFFTISGFLIVTLLLRERDRHGAVSLRAFYGRRALRIFPLYYGVLLATALMFATVQRHGAGAHAFFVELPRCALYLTNWWPSTTMLAITWSLSAEEQFYAVWPPLEKLTRHRTVPILLALVAAGEIIAFGALDGVWSAAFGGRPPAMLREVTFTPILLGVLLAHVLHDRRGYAAAARLLGGRATPIALVVALFAFLALAPDDLTGWPRFVVHLLMLAFVASSVVREDHLLAPVWRLRGVARIGVVSYGVYLLHPFALDGARRVVDRGLLPAPALFPLTLALAWAIAEVSFRFYEQPLLRLKGRFAR